MLKLIVATWIVLLSGMAYADNGAPFSRQLADTITQVKSGASVNERTDAAMRLAEMTRG